MLPIKLTAPFLKDNRMKVSSGNASNLGSHLSCPPTLCPQTNNQSLGNVKRLALCHGVSIFNLPGCGLMVSHTWATQCDPGTGKVPTLTCHRKYPSLLHIHFRDLKTSVPYSSKDVYFFISLIISPNSKWKKKKKWTHYWVFCKGDYNNLTISPCVSSG